jgi:ABC-2 type transport system ATP-binding protein
LDEAEHCDRLALLHAGRLVALGTPAQLKEVYSQKVILEVTAPRIVEALDTLAAHDWAHEASVFGDRIHVVVDGRAEGERSIRSVLKEQGIEPVAIDRIPPSLEDVFIHYVSGEPQ